MLQIVQRRTVRSVKHALVNKNLLLKDKCIDKSENDSYSLALASVNEPVPCRILA